MNLRREIKTVTISEHGDNLEYAIEEVLSRYRVADLPDARIFRTVDVSLAYAHGPGSYGGIPMWHVNLVATFEALIRP